MPLAAATFCWWGLAVFIPALMAKGSLARAKGLIQRKKYSQAESLLNQAAHHPKHRAEAICLLAQCAIRQNQPQAAIAALDQVLPKEDADDHRPLPPSDAGIYRHASFLMGIAYSMLGRGTAAESEFAEVLSAEHATVEERIAAAQACLIAGDVFEAEKVLALIDQSPLQGPLLARFQICRAALCWHQNEWSKALENLPPDEICPPLDRDTVQMVRHLAKEKIDSPPV